ncbi:hypothetical protein DCAR_0833159 [Daucus carota subsp. sativus]|uniref:Uncharacterized protein n=1 Tax=Daucus carota subsp. sativus TaxID=79200 RepID=A0AAF0XV14_DAUCS|nr:PREDICTED: eukaryotic translation initiation factor 4B2-like [Daucus carota subsp. sativus]WOH13649.1 hypothetical protein DCAR_0833159 [Daucus carota subsp. sativus]
MSKPWGKIGAWAADAEQAELEEKEAAAAQAAATSSPSFPPLKEAVTSKPKKKHNKMTLQEFTTGGGGGAAARLTADEMMRLPRGPQERSGDEMYGKIGGGFSGYGGVRGGGGGAHRDGGGGAHRERGGYGGGFGEGASGRGRDVEVHSRADEVDNWAMSKKSGVGFDRGGGSKYGSFGGKADEVDNWAAGKKQYVAAAPPPARGSGGFGSGFRDFSGPGGGNDRWTRGGGGGGVGGGEEPQRPRLVLDKPRTDGVVNEGSGGAKVVTNKPNPFGAARPREEVLTEKGLDWRKVDMEIEAKKSGSRPSSGQSSRPGSAQSERGGEGGVALQQVVMKAKVNPFGDAKPREVLLEEKGLDWKKIDLDLERRRIDRPETEEEKNLKVEIDQLKRELEIESAANVNRESQEDQTSLHDRILQKEKELEQITREFDDKVRFAQKPIERPGSGSGRSSVVPERPHFRSGSFGESRNIEFTERPRSRGTGDAWPRQRDERRGFQGGRERGFLGSRDVDRSGDRW